MAEQLPDQLARIASGDGEAFARFYEEWFGFVLGQARRAVRGDDHAAADLTQEVFVKFIRRTPILDSSAAIGAWLKRAALTTAMDRAKGDRRRTARETSVGAAGVKPSIGGEHVEWLRSELASLDAEARDMLVQRFGLGRTLAQIGAVFGLSAGAVDGRIGRVIQILRHRAGEGSGDA
ncbi:MAG: sigma-70 family RNA polymerase sigma factor [Phycisphaerae bacterium]|nr:sigma-70 family RNA polymerase sigma factor [Phycisphaerae bacterium]